MESGSSTFAEPRIGDIIEGYEVLKSLGAGGMGRVYQVRNILSNRIDAMKILLPDLADNPDLTARFLSEIQVLGSLRHPNIAELHTAFRVGDRFAMILEFVEGEPLNVRLQKGRMAPSDAVACISQVLEAVGYAHDKGIVHRDIKPGNVILTASGSVKLLDFGIAKSAASPDLTAAGTAMGSAYYMSPEQVMGRPPDRRSDLYSVGITLYEMVAGQRPIRGETEYAIMEGHLKHVPESATDVNPLVPSGLSAVIAKSIAKDRADRYQAAEEFLAALRPWSDSGDAPVGPPVSRRAWWTAAIVALVLITVSLGAYWWLSRPNHRLVLNPKHVDSGAIPPAPSGDMTLIPAGEALLGADKHSVFVAAFYLDTTEVSNAAFAAFRRATAAPVPRDALAHPDLPVVNVSYDEAVAYARWAGKRLPRASEWEKAVRGPDGQPLPWGKDLRPSHASLDGSGAASGLQPVRSHPDGASPYGVLNLVGNAWEWVDARAYPGDEQMKNLMAESWARTLQPPLSPTERFMQIRGGSYSVSARPEDLPQLVYDFAILPARVGRPDVGFRCARDVEPR